MLQLPKQTISIREKLKDDKQWAKDTIDHTVYYADNYWDSSGNNYWRKLSNYELYNNVINQKDFERECNPLGIEVGQFKDNVKPYNKTYNKIQVLLGEELKRRMDFRAVLVNQTGIRKKEIKRTELMRNYIESEIDREKQRIMKRLQSKNPPPNVEGQAPEQAKQVQEEYQNQLQNEVNKVLNPAEIDKFMSIEYQEAREITVQRLINYFVRKLYINDKKNDSFKHALIAGEEVLWVGEENGDPQLKVVNPLGFFYHKSPETKYIEDSEFAGYRTHMTTSDILDRWHDELTEEEVHKIEGEGHTQGMLGMEKDMIGPQMKYHNVDIEFEYNKDNFGREGSYGFSGGEDWEVYHTEWKSRAKVYFVTYFDEEGESQMDMLSEEFKVPANAVKKSKYVKGKKKTFWELEDGTTFEEAWVPEVWEGTRIGYNIYVDIRKKANQHRPLDNPWKVKLGYHGVVYNAMNAPSVSIMDRMKPYQYLYFIVYHKLKKLIARDRGVAYKLDLSTIDDEIGLEKTLYYLDELDLDLYNPLQNADEAGSSHRGTITSAINRSNMQHIMSYVELLRQLDVEIGEAAGVTKQREGSIGSYEAVTNTQQAIQQSSHITEVFFHNHMQVWERAMTSLIECAQVLWKEKRVVKQFVLDDLSRHILDFSGKEIYNADFGIFISDAMRDAELIETLKQMALPILQNQGKVTDIAKIFKALSASELEQEFIKEERERERKEQQQQEMLRQTELQKLEAAKEIQEREFTHEKELETMKLEAQIRMKEIDVFKFQQDLDMNNDGIPDPLQLEKLKSDSDYKAKELDFKKKQHSDNVSLQKEKLKIDKKKASQTKKPK